MGEYLMAVREIARRLINGVWTTVDVEEDGGGGSQASCATARLSVNATGLSSGTTLPFDTALEDTDGYFDSANNRFIIPAGKAGSFLVGLSFASFNMATATRVTGAINNSGADANINATSPVQSNGGDVAGSALLKLADGDVITPKLTFDGGDTADVNKNISSFWLIKIT
jgi:hypothetical protein